MSLEVSNPTNNLDSQKRKSLKYSKYLLKRKSLGSLKMSKINDIKKDSSYPKITVQNVTEKEKEMEISKDGNKENIINNNNNNNKNENAEGVSPTKGVKSKFSISSKLSNSLLYLKRKGSKSEMSAKSSYSFLMTPLMRKKDKKSKKDLAIPNSNTTYGQPSKNNKPLRVNSKISMNSSPGEPNYFSDVSSAHSFVSHSTTNSIFSALCKKKNGKKLKRKDFSESIKELGSGATGNIHLVYRKDNPEKYYALKEFIIPKHKVSQENERKFFKHLQSEYTIGTILHHRNVVEVENFIYNDYYKRNRKERHVYQVMEYCNGGDLFDAIQSGKMSQANILCFFKQLMEGLSYIHSMGVAHRDLKP